MMFLYIFSHFPSMGLVFLCVVSEAMRSARSKNMPSFGMKLEEVAI